MNTTIFSTEDQVQLQSKQIDLEQLKSQLEGFKQGYAATQLFSSAGIGNGVYVCDAVEQKRLLESFSQRIQYCELLKFVPASGAATRMFKHLFEWRDAIKMNSEKNALSLGGDRTNSASATAFGLNLKQYAFYADLEKEMQTRGKNLSLCMQEGDYLSILDALLNDDGLAYASLPKALIVFHSYSDEKRTSLEEHLVEAAAYAAKEGQAFIHFTVSPEHLDKFKRKLQETQEKYEKRFNIKYTINFSVQKPSTDTIAVDMENNVYRDADGVMVFRPGGHGALIENLNDVKGDIIFIKNIDNVTTDALRADTISYKKILASLLLELREQVFVYLRILENLAIPGEEQIEEIRKFAEQKLAISFKDFDLKTKKEQKNLLFDALNRPMRICGMVKNEGEPGGGPFWVKNPKNGELSLQIVESSQVDMQNSAQKAIFESATHFNPVDLVCSVRDYNGKCFDLRKYVDPGTAFISKKSVAGKDIKALELPGLWNGAMAYWTTVFVEVPPSIFTPVKIVNDLQRKEHL